MRAHESCHATHNKKNATKKPMNEKLGSAIDTEKEITAQNLKEISEFDDLL
jgi:hypothetical protein